MNKKNLTGLLSVLCVFLGVLVLLCACDTGKTPANTDPAEVTTSAPNAATEEATEAEATETEAANVTYTITVVDQNGDPVVGADIKMCDENGLCLLPVKTNENGVAVFEKNAAEYRVSFGAVLAGYVIDTETLYDFENGSTEMTITIEKASTPVETTPVETEPVTEPETQNPLHEVYDISGHASSVEFGAAGYTEKVFQFFNYNDNVLLGEFDLSKYEAIIVTYGCDSAAMLGDVGSKIVLTSNGPVLNGLNSPVEGADILASTDLLNPNGHWKAGERVVTISLDTDYSGPVYICHQMASSDGLAISSIIFVKKLAPYVYMSQDAGDVLEVKSLDLMSTLDTPFAPGTYDQWESKTFTLKVGATGGYWETGVIALNTDVYEFGYRFGGASPLNNGLDFFPGSGLYTQPATPDQIAAAQAMGYSTAASFKCLCAEAALGVGENYVQVLVMLNNDPEQVYVLRDYTVILEN